MRGKWNRVLLFVLIASAFGVGLLSFRKNLRSEPSIIDGFVVAVFNPVSSFFSRVMTRIDQTIDEYLFATRTAKKADDYRLELEKLRIENTHLKKELSAISENQNFENAYTFLDGKYLRASILAFDPFTQSKTMLISQGRKQGVGSGNVVFNEDGLVGRVVQVFDNSSKVLLLIDDDFAVDTRSARSGARCLVKGLGTAELAALRYPFLSQVEYFQNAAEMLPGDELETSGISAIYPRGIRVGKLKTLSSDDKGLFGKAVVVPAVDFAKLDHVYVLVSVNE